MLAVSSAVMVLFQQKRNLVSAWRLIAATPSPHMLPTYVSAMHDRDGLRFTYDQWRKALMCNKSVSILRGLQFGMLDEDNDGEVSLGDITRAVFRRAPDRDLNRIRRFLEVRLTLSHIGQVRLRYITIPGIW